MVDAKQNFLEAALAVGLECEIIKPEDVLRHLTPEVLASHLPPDAKTALLSASLQAGKMDADLVFEALEVRIFARYMPKNRLWSCIAEAAKRVLSEEPSSASKSKALFGDGKTRRRPNLSRRPARLSQTRSKKSASEFDVDTDVGSRWSNSVSRDPETGGASASSTPVSSPSVPGTAPSASSDPFSEWIEETATGDALSRRKR